MGETFTLRGGAPREKKGPGKFTIVLGLVAAAVLIWVVVRVIRQKDFTSQSPGYLQRYQHAEERKQVLEAILPGARLPEPFVLRGAIQIDSTRVVWMRRDFDDTHALIFTSALSLTSESLDRMLAALGGQELPTRQLINEEGVEIDKRAPFAEEYRTLPTHKETVRPPTGWTEDWDPALLRTTDSEQGKIRIDLDIGDGNLYPTTPYHTRAGKYWWALVDLSPRSSDDRDLFLYFAVTSEEAPDLRELIDFLRALLGIT